MKIHEIINEQAPNGRVSKRYQQSTRGLHKFHDKENADRVYELNRVMMAAACSDGTNPLPDHFNDESWVGKNNLSIPYTKAEHDMLKQAYQAAGSTWKDLNNGDMRSMELKSTNKTSPIAAQKKNRFGV